MVACGNDGSDTLGDEGIRPGSGIKPDGEQNSDRNIDKNTDQEEEKQDSGENKDLEEDSQNKLEKPQTGGDATLSQSGSFISGNADKLYLYVEWAAQQDQQDSEVTISVDVYLVHYALTVRSRSGNIISVHEQVYTFSTPQMVYEDNVLTQTQLATYEISVPRAARETLEVVLKARWKFAGTLNEEYIDWIEAENTVLLG
jgi:hypothetical protein